MLRRNIIFCEVCDMWGITLFDKDSGTTKEQQQQKTVAAVAAMAIYRAICAANFNC